MKSVFLLIIITVLFSTNTYTQTAVRTGTIKGIIKDSVSGQAINYATVTLMKSTDSSIVTGAISKENGSFLISQIPYGNYDMKMSYIGFKKTFIRNISIDKEHQQIELGEMNLSPAITTTDEVVVSGKQELITYSLDKKIVNVAQHPNAKGGTAADVLQNIPSVQVDIDGDVSLRGSKSFTVLIDGRPIGISGQDALKQYPADIIENIEIITNPSAKYDPEGTSGIINLILKKQNITGINGMLNLSSGTKDKYSTSGNFNYKRDKLNLFTNLSYYDRKYHPSTNFSKEIFTNNVYSNSNHIENRLMVTKGYNVQLGSDYQINQFNTVSLSLFGGNNDFLRQFPANYFYWNQKDLNSEKYNLLYVLSKDKFDMTGFSRGGNLNHQLILPGEKGHELNSNFSYWYWDGNIKQNYDSYYTDENFTAKNDIIDIHKVFNDGMKKNMNFKIDYTLPISQLSKFEAGIEGNMINKDFNFQYEDFDTIHNEWLLNYLFSNNTKFTQKTMGLYSTYSNNILGIQYMLGLRGEYYDRKLEQLTLTDNFDYNKLDFFPSVFLSYQIRQNMDLQLNYSRRTTRPDDRTLNPFPDFADKEYVSKGNPYLKPEYINNVEFNYRYSFGQSFISLESYYRQTDDLIAQTLTPIDSTGKLLISADNMDKDKLFGGNIVVNYSPVPWFRINTTASAFKYYLLQNFNGVDTTRNRDVFSLFGSLLFILPTSTMIQFQANYSGEQITANGIQKPMFYADLVFRQDFFKKKITAVLNVQNVFGTGKYDFSEKLGNIRSFGYMQSEGPTLSLSLSYKINDYKRRQQPGSNEVNIDFQGMGGGQGI